MSLCIGGAAQAPAQDRGPRSVEKPRLLEAREQQRADAPRGVQRVAVLKLRIDARDGQVDEVDVRSVEVIDSYAPKVFARKGGDWRVAIKGQRSASYPINNPLRDIEIENPEGSDAPYSRVRPSGPVDWTVVVPLYKDGRSLNAARIEISDRETERVWVNVPLPDRPRRGRRSR